MKTKISTSLGAFVLFTSMLLPLNVTGQGNGPAQTPPGVKPGASPAPFPFPSPSPGSFIPPDNKDGKPKGWTVKLYHKDRDGKMPGWVEAESKRSLYYLQGEGAKNPKIKLKGTLKPKSKIQPSSLSNKARPQDTSVLDSWTEYTTLSAETDDLGYTYVRLDQTYNNVSVFSGQVITTLDANNNVIDATGDVYLSASQVSTQPQISAQQAIDAAKTALGYNGNFARTPESELIVLPFQVRNRDENDADGAALVYKVELLVESGLDADGRWFYFVNANNGNIEWQYDAMDKGTGQGVYNGYVSFPTAYITSAQSGGFPFAIAMSGMTGIG